MKLCGKYIGKFTLNEYFYFILQQTTAAKDLKIKLKFKTLENFVCN